MLKLQPPLVLQLTDGQLLCWQQAVAVRLRVLAGRVWVTRPGDLDDHFLGAGEQLRLDARSRVLIGAEGEARLALEPP
jgi:ferric-dicitrate binding protein FerR (iron transport regulator)